MLFFSIFIKKLIIKFYIKTIHYYNKSLLNMATIKQIKKFNQIDIIPESLIVIDIDDTLIKYDGIDFIWWKNKVNKYYTLTKNTDLSEILANQDWNKLIEKCNPELVDDCVHYFIESAKSKKCHIILLTARNNVIKDLTKEHLSKVNLYFEHIYFNENKGDEIVKIMNFDYLDSCKNIIVIDDREQNLIDIKNKIDSTKFNLHLYKII